MSMPFVKRRRLGCRLWGVGGLDKHAQSFMGICPHLRVFRSFNLATLFSYSELNYPSNNI